ncbi:MAG: hypothetical protein L6V93_15175 [Clostridiales bacterium]|nr:MAG: hypothetical protein L6V93_15175 [Clostridiales bacterium]
MFDKAVKGLTKENFTVKAGEITTELTDVKRERGRQDIHVKRKFLRPAWNTQLK